MVCLTVNRYLELLKIWIPEDNTIYPHVKVEVRQRVRGVDTYIEFQEQSHLPILTIIIFPHSRYKTCDCVCGQCTLLNWCHKRTVRNIQFFHVFRMMFIQRSLEGKNLVEEMKLITVISKSQFSSSRSYFRNRRTHSSS